MKNPLGQCSAGHSIKSPVRKFAGGGVVDLLKNRKQTIDAAVDAATNPDAVVRDNPPSAGAARPSMGAQADDYAAQAAKIEAEQLNAAKARMATPKKKGFFGFANGGKIQGQGTPTSDSIRATVKETGEPIDVSTEERILSKMQDSVLERLARDLGYENLENMLETMTGEPVGPTIKDGKQAAAYGGKPQDMTYEDVTNSPIGQAPKPAANVPAPKPVDQYGNDMTATNKMKAQLGEAPVGVNPLAAQSPVATAASMMPPTKAINQDRDYSIPADQQRDAQAAIATLPEKSPVSTTEQPAAKPVNPITQFQNPDFSLIGADRKGYEAARQKIAPEAPTAAQAVEQARNPLLSVPAAVGQKTFGVDYAVTPKQGTVTADAPLGNTPANTATRAAPTNSFTETGTTMNATNPLTTINMQANNESMARANAIRQSTGEGDGTKVAMLGNSGRAESQALMDKWGREDQTREMMQEMGRNPKAAGAIANLMHTQQGSETAREELANRRQIAGDETETRRMGLDVAVRGQDIEAQTRAAQMAGNPIDNELKQTQVRNLSAQVDSEKQTAELRSRYLQETDPTKKAAIAQDIASLSGKSGNTNYRDQFMTVGGGQEWDEKAGVMRNVPQRLIDLRTGQEVAQPAQAKPTYEQFAAQMSARYPGKVSADQLKQAYAKQYGA